MLASKLIVVVLSLAACGASLVALRQGRLDAAHELASSRLRTAQLDEQLSRVRARIATRVHPEHVAAMVEALGTLEPALAEPPRSPDAPIDDTPLRP